MAKYWYFYSSMSPDLKVRSRQRYMQDMLDVCRVEYEMLDVCQPENRALLLKHTNSITVPIVLNQEDGTITCNYDDLFDAAEDGKLKELFTSKNAIVIPNDTEASEVGQLECN